MQVCVGYLHPARSGAHAIKRLFITPDYRAPITLLVGAALLVSALVTLALSWPSAPARSRIPLARCTPPWLVGVVALVSSAAWFGLLHLPEALRVGALVLLPILAALALAAGIVALIWRWSASRGWTNWHELALAFGAITASTLYGMLFTTAGSPIDQVGEGVVGLATLALLALLARRQSARTWRHETSR